MTNLSASATTNGFEADVEMQDAISRGAAALKKKLGDEMLPALVQSLEDRLNFHRRLLVRQRNISRPMSNFLTYAIPCAAAFITFLTTLKGNPGDDGASHFFSRLALWLPEFGLALSILTLINSIYRPVERKLMVSQTLINLHDLELRLFLLLQEHNRPGEGTGKTFYQEIVQWDKELSKLGGTMVQMLVPQELRDRTTGKRDGEENINPTGA